MRYLGLEIGREVDNGDGPERTFLWADTASDAKAFRYESYLRFGRDFDAELPCPDHRTRLLAFLSTFLWLALWGWKGSQPGLDLW